MPMMRAVDLVRTIASHAMQPYIAAWDAGDAKLAAAHIDTPLRLAHLVAQCAHECEGFTITRESMMYTTPARIAEIFAKVKSPDSAPLFPGEAAMLVRQERDLGDRFYGPGGPSPLYAQNHIMAASIRVTRARHAVSAICVSGMVSSFAATACCKPPVAKPTRSLRPSPRSTFSINPSC